ncbi:MAG: cupredoxin domain-containing protein [Dehalococcoidia bacterium]
MVALLALVVVAAVVSGCGDDASADDVTVAIKYSHYQPELITANAGEPVTITLRNDDPIEHEWIVGTADVHERHRTGTEPVHDAIPTEVTIPALSTRVTTVMFSEPGEYLYVCHLPGHEAYGMVGTVQVVGE